MLASAGCTDLPPLLDPDVTTVVFEVGYMPGAEPYTGEAGDIADVWTVAEINARAVLGEDRDYVFPRSLDEMQPLTNLSPGTFTRDEIVAAADAHRTPSTSTTATLYLVWLDGVYRYGSRERDEVLAISIGDTGVVGVFKPAIERSTSIFDDDASKLAEQVALVHELGHAFGLVARTLPMTRDHSLDGNHCDEEGCIMYPGNLAGHVRRVTDRTTDAELVLFGDECLRDARAARE